MACLKTFIWKRTYNKIYKEQHWFKLWVTEGYSIRQLSNISGYSESKLKRIKNYWLSKEAPALSKIIYQKAKYLLFDGTYFHKSGCLAIIIDYARKKIISYTYIDKEGYHSMHPIFLKLQAEGLTPKAITIDGHRMVIKAILDVWPQIKIQRCLFHIQNQGLMWIRTFPKTEAGKKLRGLLKTLTSIHSNKDMADFLSKYSSWKKRYETLIKQLPKTSVANTDLQRTMRLINNALPNMFYFIKDRKIAPTTNYLESLYSQIKHQYRNHRGLTEKHKIAYLKWFCYFKNLDN